ncbi:MAG: DedA family protein [Mycobacterium leprae]
MTSVLANWGVLGLTLMYLLEGMAAPLPIEIPLWMTGQMLVARTHSYGELVFVTWLGSCAGNIVAFGLARIGGRPLLMKVSRLFRAEEQVKRAQRWMDRYGLWFVAVSRWINWGFGISLWLSGFSGIKPEKALGLMMVNNLLWSFWWVEFGRLLVGVLRFAGLPDWLILLPGVVGLVVIGIWRAIRRYRTRAVE